MARLSKEEQARRDGMQWALRIAEEGGVEALKRECEIRSITDLPVGLREKEADQFCNNVKANTFDAIRIMALTVLTDEFDFDTEQCNRFMDRFNLKTECLKGAYVNWHDLIEQLHEDLDIKLEIRENRNNVHIKG
jgi:hypothetical protein